MTLTHILVDFENTQPSAQNVALLPGHGVKLWIFRGPSQKKYDAEFAEALLPLGDRVRIVKSEKSGRNALDMHIAFQMGRLIGELAQVSAPASTAFVVVSRDTDYDPLLQHVRALGFTASRAASLKAAVGSEAAEKAAASKAGKKKATPAKQTPAAKASAKAARSANEVPVQPAAGTSSDGAAIDKIVERLREHPKSRPAKRGALEKWLASHLRGKVTESEVPSVVAELERRSVVTITGTKVEYPGLT